MTAAGPRKRIPTTARKRPQRQPRRHPTPSLTRSAIPANSRATWCASGIQSQRLLGDFFRRQAGKVGNEPLDPLNIAGAFTELLRGMVADPAVDHGGAVRAVARLYGSVGAHGAPHDGRRRRTPGRARARRQALQGQGLAGKPDLRLHQAVLPPDRKLAAKHGGESRRAGSPTRRRIEFYTKQFADAFAPTNFVLDQSRKCCARRCSATARTSSAGLDNLLEDLDRGEGQLSIRQTTDVFRVGENIATAPGKVVFRNELIEMLQYDPTTKEVYKRPLLIFPPWINKFYILDLRPENSFIRWAMAQGYTVFVVSWVNPDRKLAKKTFEDYMREGIFAALDAVEKRPAFTIPMSSAIASAARCCRPPSPTWRPKSDDRIHSATFFAAQADFSEAGDLQIFIDDVQLEALEQQMEAAGGVLEGRKMATTFNMLRANDLIWSFVVNNYLLGEIPVPFDLLYWNSDTTRMPEATHLFYLRQFYKNNALAKGEMILGGVKLDLSKVKMPIYLQSAKDDHIAPFRSVYKSTQLFKGPIRFIIAGSGHIAGVINPPRQKNISIGRTTNCRRRSRSGRPARPSIPVPGGPTGMRGCRNCRARKCPRASPATESSRRSATRREPMSRSRRSSRAAGISARRAGDTGPQCRRSGRLLSRCSGLQHRLGRRRGRYLWNVARAQPDIPHERRLSRSPWKRSAHARLAEFRQHGRRRRAARRVEAPRRENRLAAGIQTVGPARIHGRRSLLETCFASSTISCSGAKPSGR